MKCTHAIKKEMIITTESGERIVIKNSEESHTTVEVSNVTKIRADGIVINLPYAMDIKTQCSVVNVDAKNGITGEYLDHVHAINTNKLIKCSGFEEFKRLSVVRNTVKSIQWPLKAFKIKQIHDQYIEVEADDKTNFHIKPSNFYNWAHKYLG